MDFLSFTEYKEMSLEPVDQEEFEVLNRRANQVINQETRYFYRHQNFENDHEWRKEAVKNAITQQIDFFSQTGSSSLEKMNNEPMSFSAGRTSITNANTQSEEKSRATLLSADAKSYLTGTGLLYRGIGRGPIC